MKLSTPVKILIAIVLLCLAALIFLVSGYRFSVENDYSGNGEIDEWSYFSVFGKRLEYQKDKNGDGKPDYIEYYKDDRVTKVMTDFNYDGNFETTAYYDQFGNTMKLLERDANEDGRIDRRTTYDDMGKPIKIEADNDFDGTFETVSEKEEK